jgi:hypothetical protein
MFNLQHVDYCLRYKDLGTNINEHMNYAKIIIMLYFIHIDWNRLA